MKRQVILTCGVLLSTILLQAQDIKKEAEAFKTKMDLFTSRLGSVTKITDSKLPNLKTEYSSPETRVRKIGTGASASYFFQIEKKAQYSNSTASIEYSDITEVLKALTALKSEVEKDTKDNPDYLENRFTTVDGFQVGYYISKGKPTWFLKLEKFGSDNTLFIDNPDIIEAAFTNAKTKIEAWKNS